MSFKFNAALKEEKDNELDNEEKDTLFDEMEEEMRLCMEQEMGLLLEQEAMESQQGALINQDEQGNEPTYGITKSIWSEESLHNWGKIGKWGGKSSSRDPRDIVHPKEDKLPSIKNTSAWFDIHQFKGWESQDEGDNAKLPRDKTTQEINTEDGSIVSTISQESLESPSSIGSAREVVYSFAIPKTNEIRDDDIGSVALVSLGSKSAHNEQPPRRVKRQKQQRDTLIKF